MVFVCVSRNITSARRHAESGHEVTDRCELLSNSAGGVVYPSCSVVESEAWPVVSLTLNVWLRLNNHTSSCISFWPRHQFIAIQYVWYLFCGHDDETAEESINLIFVLVCSSATGHLKSPSAPPKCVFLIVTSLGCLAFTVQNHVIAKFDTRSLFSPPSADGGKFLHAHLIWVKFVENTY